LRRRIGISLLTGAALSLVPMVVLAMVSTAAIRIAYGDHMWAVALTMGLVAAAVQIGYLAGMAVVGLVRPGENMDMARNYPLFSRSGKV
jgi:hypothetical protein